MGSSKTADITDELLVTDFTATGGDDYWFYLQSIDGFTDYKLRKSALAAYVESLVSLQENTVLSGIVAYAAGGQTNATELEDDYNRIDTVGSANASVKPDVIATPGFKQTVQNNGTNDLNYYPPLGNRFYVTGSGAMSINAPISISPGNQVTVICYDNGVLTFV